MKNGTLSVPNEVYLAPEVERSRLEAQQKQVQGEIDRFRAGDRLGRDEIHERAVSVSAR